MSVEVENQLRECRREKGVSQQDVADAIKVDRRSIIRYENGVRTPTLATALRLSDYYERPVNDIFHLEKIVKSNSLIPTGKPVGLSNNPW